MRDGGPDHAAPTAADGITDHGSVHTSLDEQTFRDASRVVQLWVLVVGLVALAVPIVVSVREGFGLSVATLATAAALVLASAGHIELGRLLDRAAREQQRPHKGLSAWAMACVVLLPGWYVLPVIALTYAHAWWRDRHLPKWKWMGSALYMVLATMAARAVQHATGVGVGLTTGSSIVGVALVAASCLTFMVVESGLLVCFVYLNRVQGESWLRRTLSDPLFYATEFGVLSLGALTGLVATVGGWYVLLVAPLFLLMQQAVLHRPLQERADIDAKTGALHYRVWLRWAASEVARLTGEGRPWAVLFADIDHFHRYNQTHGHLGGDRALAATADAIRGALPPGTLVGRFGGEEFCALLPGAADATALAAAERVRLRVNGMRPPSLPAQITVSIGVACVPAGDRPASVPAVVAHADQALYEAKRAGRDCSRLWSSEAGPDAAVDPS
jgi:diguanylate cyclase (GGDEF)-like protein